MFSPLFQRNPISYLKFIWSSNENIQDQTSVVFDCSLPAVLHSVVGHVMLFDVSHQLIFLRFWSCFPTGGGRTAAPSVVQLLQCCIPGALKKIKPPHPGLVSLGHVFRFQLPPRVSVGVYCPRSQRLYLYNVFFPFCIDRRWSVTLQGPCLSLVWLV